VTASVTAGIPIDDEIPRRPAKMDEKERTGSKRTPTNSSVPHEWFVDPALRRRHDLPQLDIYAGPTDAVAHP
jgi:hypothetical protein